MSVFLINQPMIFNLQAVLPGPLAELHMVIPQVSQLHDAGQATSTGIFTYEYFLPPHVPKPFLQIATQISGSTQPPAWVGQNIVLEYFPDTMQIDLHHPLDTIMAPGATGIDIAWALTDTAIYATPLLPPTFLYQSRCPLFSHYGQVLPPPSEFPPIPLPPLPPRRWNNDISRGVLIGCHMPNIDLDSSNYRADGLPKPFVPDFYAGDWNACGPAATSNSFMWLRKIHPDIDSTLGDAFGEGDSAARKIMAEFSDLMDRLSEDQVYITDFVEAKLAFIDKYKLPLRVSWQSMHRGDSSIASPNRSYGHKADRDIPAAQPGQGMSGITPDFLLKAMEDSCDTELLFNWQKIDSAGNVTYPAGHYVTLTGIRKAGDNWKIKWKDDKVQDSLGGTRQGISPMEVDSATGMVRIPGLDNDRWGKCFISNVAIECYDETVTFNSAQGRAFRDPSGSGSSSGGQGAGGLTVNLVDSTSGTVLQSSTTLPDGSYYLHDIPSPLLPMYVEFVLPPGLQISPPNMAHDSADSDFDPLTGRSPVFTFPEDTSYIFDIGLRVPALSVKPFRRPSLIRQRNF
ncbi:MAG: SdrD B-like domain-containing protein [Bacteroidia bacterium]